MELLVEIKKSLPYRLRHLKFVIYIDMIWFYLNSLKFMKFMMSSPELVILSCLNPGDTKIVISDTL